MSGAGRLRTYRGASARLPLRTALLAERPDPLPEVLGREARLAQLDELAVELRREGPWVLAERPNRPLVALQRERRVGAELRGDRQPRLLELVGLDHPVDETHLVSPFGIDVPAEQEQLVRVGDTANLDELAEARVGVDEPDLRRRHAELHAARGDPQVARHRQLEAAADGVSVDGRENRVAVALDGLDRLREGVGHQSLGLLGERLLVEGADVVARREDRAVAGEEHAAGVEAVDHLRERVQDLVVECAALLGIADPDPRYELGRLVQDELPRGELATQAPPACRPPTPTAPPGT